MPRPRQPKPTEPQAPHLDARHELGRRGEDLAARFLTSRGFVVIERNWRPASGGSGAGDEEVSGRIKLRGELDVIAWEGAPLEGGTLCFIEVKARASSDWGTPGQAVDAPKQRQIVRLVQAYLVLHGASEPRLWDAPCRFDVVEVWLPPGETPRVALHRAAFDATPAPDPRRF